MFEQTSIRGVPPTRAQILADPGAETTPWTAIVELSAIKSQK
jgi:hypothetical protein